MKILITGSNGFVGKNLKAYLSQTKKHEILCFDVYTKEEKLDEFLSECDFIFHFAAVNRPQNTDDFMTVNRDFTQEIISKLENIKNNCPIVATSSIQAELENEYGISKREMENALFEHNKKTGAPTYIYRLPNLFGKWCKPNYNSVVATFCDRLARDKTITVDDNEKILQLLHIDDICKAFLRVVENKPEIDKKGFCELPPIHEITLGKLAEKLEVFSKNRENLTLPIFKTKFDEQLYSTFVSYLPINELSYSLDMKSDERGAFFECIKSPEFGQISISVTNPGYIRGGHWHHTKTEKFCVIKGKAALRFKKLGEDKITEYILSDENIRMIDIPSGYLHWIENIGDDEMILLIWANEIFNDKKPDTYTEEVL